MALTLSQDDLDAIAALMDARIPANFSTLTITGGQLDGLAGPVQATDSFGNTVASASALSTLSGYVDTEVAAIKAKTDNLPSDPADQSELAALIAAVSALATAIKAKTDLINTGVTIQGSSPVASSGTISEIVIGDDYYTANGRSFSWTVPAITGMSVADVTFWFGGQGQGDAASSSWLVEGTVTDADGGNWTCAAELPRSATVDCVPGFYNWSGAIHHNSNGRQITKVRKNKTNRTQLVQKFTSEES